MPTPDALRRLRSITRRLDQLRQQTGALAAERRTCVATLVADGWSLQRIADALGVSKAAVQKLTA